MRSSVPAGRTYVLGAINGVIYSGVLLCLIWRYNVYLVSRNIEDAERLSTSPVQLTLDNINVPVVVLLFVVLFTAASYLVCHCWGKLQKSLILFWQIVGVTAITGWNVLMVSLLWLEKEATGQVLSYERIASSTGPMFGPMSIALVIAVNLIYAAIIKLSVDVLPSFNTREIR